MICRYFNCIYPYEGPMAIRRISSCSVSSSVEESSMRSTRKYQMKSTLESISTLAHGLMTSTDVTDSNKTNAYMSMTAYLKGSMSKPNISKVNQQIESEIIRQTNFAASCHCCQQYRAPTKPF
jgi:hypothetical protein